MLFVAFVFSFVGAFRVLASALRYRIITRFRENRISLEPDLVSQTLLFPFAFNAIFPFGGVRLPVNVIHAVHANSIRVERILFSFRDSRGEKMRKKERETIILCMRKLANVARQSRAR